MNTLFALALAFSLSTAPNTDDKLTSRETSTYVITDHLALWTTNAGKLKLSMAQQTGKATIAIRKGKGVLYQETVNLRKGAQQTFDLSQMNDGTYEIQVTVGQETTTKTIRIERAAERMVRLS
ncbi:hypothetical protein [Spirosoma areae]